MTWPGTPGGGGAFAPWGDPVRVFVQAAVASGRNWRVGPNAADRLDDGNVLGHVNEGGTFWVDLACAATNVEVVDGATAKAGLLSRDEAATLTVELYDPDRRFDPLNVEGPYWYGTQTRLRAGIPIQVFAEVLDGAGGVTRFDLFAGTTDAWRFPIEPEPDDRRATITATGAVKQIAAKNFAETAPVGAGDTTAARLARIRSYFNLAGALEQVGGASPVTLQASTFAQTAWEHLNRTIDDEVGFLHVLPNGTIRWWSRLFWFQAQAPPVVVVGCAPGGGGLDIVTDAPTITSDEQLRNAVYASRSGGTQQVVKSTTSIAQHGGVESTLNRTDLGLADDPQVATWANLIIQLFAFPQPTIAGVQMQPTIGDDAGAAARWRQVLGVRIITDSVRVIWDDGTSAPIDQTLRVTGIHHTIKPDAWEVRWETIPATLAVGNVLHVGPHTLDKLDRGNVVGWTHGGP